MPFQRAVTCRARKDSAVQFFEDLAFELHSGWMLHGRDELAFPELAHLTLERYAPAAAVAPNYIFPWMVETDRAPRQFDLRSSFGNFTTTVVARDDFHIDVLD
jgi:hypothetical protein